MYSALVAAGLIAVFAWMQAGAAGTRMAYSLLPCGLLGVLCLGSMLAGRKSGVRLSNTCVITTLLLACYIAGRCLTSPVPYLARSDLFGILGVLGVYLLTACYLSSDRHRLWVCYGLLALAFLQMALATIQFFVQPDFILFGFTRPEPTITRAGGMYINQNHAAWMFASCAVLGLALTVLSRTRVAVKALTGFLTVAALFGLLLTISRGGYIAAAFGLAVVAAGSLFAMRLRISRRSIHIALGVIVVGALVAGAAIYAMKDQIQIEQRWARLAESNTLRARWPIWQSAINQFQLSPIVGTGAGTFYYYGRRLRAEGSLQSDHLWAHNDYLDLLAGYGAIGLALMIAVIATHVWNGARVIARHSRQPVGLSASSAALALGALGVTAVNVVHSLSDFNMHVPAF